MPSAMITLRLGNLDDLLDLADIEISAASLYPAGKVPEPHESLPYEVMRKAVRSKLLFCAEKMQTNNKNTLVGFAACHLYQNYLHLDELSVLPSVGRQGIGGHLVAQVIETSQALQCKGTTLTTFSDLPWNAPFYKKHGFNELSYSKSPVEVQAMLDEERSIGLVNRISMLKKN